MQSSPDDIATTLPAPMRKIIHVDMDAFFASVEQRDDPRLRGKPVAVGGTRERGVVAAASYEARVFGVRSAMASAAARRRCPELTFVKPRFEVYKAVSQEIRRIFSDYTDLVEPLSLDEAYLDVTADMRGLGSATRIAEEIRSRIAAETGLTASAGVSFNKFLAKLASDQNKPDGLCVVRPAQATAFVQALDIGRFHGVGPATARKMHGLGIRTGADLAARPLSYLERHFGKAGRYYHRAASGIDERPVSSSRERKSVGSETTFFRDLSERGELEEALAASLDSILRHPATPQARTLTLKLRYSDFQTITRSRTQAAAYESRAALLETARALLATVLPLSRSVRLLGLSVSSFAAAEAPHTQLGLGL